MNAKGGRHRKTRCEQNKPTDKVCQINTHTHKKERAEKKDRKREKNLNLSDLLRPAKDNIKKWSERVRQTKDQTFTRRTVKHCFTLYLK